MDELKKLEQEYRKELPSSAAAISHEAQTVLDALKRGSQPDWSKLEFLAHKLAGSSGIYGFVELSKLSRWLEDAISAGTIGALAANDAFSCLETWLVAFEGVARAAAEGREIKRRAA